jgi:hypothetical protein
MATPPKGSFKDLVCGLLDVAIPCFGESVCYRPKRGGAHTIEAVFDREAIQVDPDTEEIVASNNPRIGIKLSDIPNPPQQGDRVDIGQERFEVTDSQEDGQGGAALLLLRC